MDKNIKIEDVLKMEKPTENFFLTIEDNTPGVRFNGFKLRNMETGEVYHEYYPSDIYELDYFADHELEYAFSNKLISKVKTIGSTLNLVVGNQVVKNLVLIERHYVEGKLAANYQFKFPLFMPNSQNSIEFIYNIPKLEGETGKKLAENKPIMAKSDTFIFVEGKLQVHRRAHYVYEGN
jgi:hypothetical protein